MGHFSETSLLFVEPGFMLGASRALDIGATMTSYNYSSNESEADMRAIGSDWRAVGRDMRHALNSLGSSIR